MRRTLYLPHLMDMTSNQLMRRNERQSSELIISNHIMSSSKGCSWIVPKTLPNLAHSLRANGRRSRSHNFWRRSQRKWDNLDGRGNCDITLLVVKLSPLQICGKLRQGFILHSSNAGILLHTIPSSHFC